MLQLTDPMDDISWVKVDIQPTFSVSISDRFSIINQKVKLAKGCAIFVIFKGHSGYKALTSAISMFKNKHN